MHDEFLDPTRTATNRPTSLTLEIRNRAVQIALTFYFVRPSLSELTQWRRTRSKAS